MKKFFIIVLSILLLKAECCLCQDTNKYFPTGMKWQETSVEIPSISINMENSHIYEIGTDTVINNVTYKSVKKDGVPVKLWVREADSKVWLLSYEYPQEFKLYDFNWDDFTEALFTEYLQENECTVELKKMDIPVSYKTISLDGQDYQFHQEGTGTVIKNLGRVHELNRNSSLLGYMLPEVMLPGLIYTKVLWIEKDGVITFQSDDPYEWSTPWAETTAVNNIIHPKSSTAGSSQAIYNIYGIKVKGTQADLHALPPGIYVVNGKKIIIK